MCEKSLASTALGSTDYWTKICPTWRRNSVKPCASEGIIRIKLSHQLRASEDRIAELKAEVITYPREPSGRSSGSIAFTRRSKIDFCGRGMTVAARRNAHRAQNGVPINWSLLRVTFGLRDNSGIAILPGRRAEWP
jgi:hypothetical protein